MSIHNAALSGYGFLFEAQVISHSSSMRKACYAAIASAIEEAAKQQNADGKVPEMAAVTHKQVIHATNMSADAVDAQLRQLVHQKHGTTESWFEENKNKNDEISRNGFKTALHRLGLDLSDDARKRLRKRIALGSKTITSAQLSVFVDGVKSPIVCSDAEAGSVEGAGALCPIPSAVPPLPENFHCRDGPLQALVVSLTYDSHATVSLTAPKAKNSKANNCITSQGITNSITSQGMGGCGWVS